MTTVMEANRRTTVLGMSLTLAGAILCGGAAITHFHTKAIERDQIEYELARAKAENAELKVKEMSAEVQATEALRESAQHGYAILDHRGRVKKWNAALVKWTGYEEAELLGKDIGMLMAPDKAANHAHGYAAMIGDPASLGKTFVVECELKPRAPEKPPLRVKVSARVVKADVPNAKPYAIALIDRSRSVVELGQQ